jgi:hypothetical protein
MDVRDLDRSRPIHSANNEHQNTSSTSDPMDPSRFQPQYRIELPPLMRRHPGDGFDFRRPASSNSPMSWTSNESNTVGSANQQSIDVIDLTGDETGSITTPPVPMSVQVNDSPSPPLQQTHSRFGQATRGPRFPQEIIDLSEESTDTAQASPRHNASPISQQADSGTSPEVQFVRERQLRLPPPPPLPPGLPLFSSATFNTTFNTIDLETGDDDVEITGERHLPQPRNHHHPSFETASALRRANGVIDALVRHTRIRLGEGRSMHIIHAPRPRTRGHPSTTQFVAPDLDFGMASFDLGYDRGSTASPPVPPPPAAPEGFTRSPAEDDVLLCPNCDDELCVGDSESKRQVWIVKGCGHVSTCLLEAEDRFANRFIKVYCGECTAGRFVTKNKKAKTQHSTKPFKECVVEGCAKRTSGRTAMIQLFL